MSNTITETPMILCDKCNQYFDCLFEADIFAKDGVPELSWHSLTDYGHDCEPQATDPASEPPTVPQASQGEA